MILNTRFFKIKPLKQSFIIIPKKSQPPISSILKSWFKYIVEKSVREIQPEKKDDYSGCLATSSQGK
jgi:hypothetical protein